MQNTRVTASEFQQAFGALSDKARHEPVVITKHGRDSLVVMSAEEWERLKRRDRRAGLTTELPGEWIETVRNAKAPAAAWFAGLDRFAGIAFMEEGRKQPDTPEPADLFE